MNPYEKCPVYETPHFTLRLVRMEDAEDLLCCYASRKAAARMDSNHCGTDFYFATLAEMQACISFWLREYGQGAYVRFAVVDKAAQKAIGTVEILDGERGVLRIDLADAYETRENLSELLETAALHFTRDFPADRLIIRAENVPERIPVFRQYGFTPSVVHPGYYERVKGHRFAAEKGIAYCGLACCLCSENENCAGCRKEGCTGKDSCQVFRCCRESGRAGCWECRDFPCGAGILRKRMRAFVRFVGRYGEDMLLRLLEENEQKGFLYHYAGQLIGDYDLPETEKEILRLLDEMAGTVSQASPDKSLRGTPIS